VLFSSASCQIFPASVETCCSFETLYQQHAEGATLMCWHRCNAASCGYGSNQNPGPLVKIKIAGGHWWLWMFIPTFLLKHVEGRWWMLLVHHLMSWVA